MQGDGHRSDQTWTRRTVGLRPGLLVNSYSFRSRQHRWFAATLRQGCLQVQIRRQGDLGIAAFELRPLANERVEEDVVDLEPAGLLLRVLAGVRCLGGGGGPRQTEMELLLADALREPLGDVAESGSTSWSQRARLSARA